MNSMIDEGKYLDWLSSMGGPLLLLPTNLLSQWHGIDRVFGTGTAPTDYERACASRGGYLVPIDVGTGQGLVLGEESDTPAAWWPLPKAEAGKGAIVVRWLYAEDEDIVDRSLRNLPPDIWRPMNFSFEVGSDTLYILDSGYGGTWAKEYLSVKVTPGTYTVEEAIYKPSRKVGLALHRLTLTPKP